MQMSMDGSGAMRLALKYPDRFSSVVAFAGGYRWPEELATSPHPSYAEMFHNDWHRPHLKLLAANVTEENFAFAARSFKLPAR